MKCRCIESNCIHKSNQQPDDFVDEIINKELNNGVKKFIEKIDPNINFRYNSFNICVGPQGSSKTTSVMKELIKLCMINKIDENTGKYEVGHDYHMIILSLCE